jgi:hypothetical protein
MAKFSNAKIEITAQNFDSMFKILVNEHRKEFLKILNINIPGDITSSYTNFEIKRLLTFTGYLDYCAIIDEKSVLCIEFDSTGEAKNIKRYLQHSTFASIVASEKCKSEINFPVRMIVVYPAKVTLPPSVYASEGNLLFSLEQISLSNAINSDDVFAEICKKYSNISKLDISDEDLLKLFLLPLGNIEESPKTFCEKVATFLGEILKKDPKRYDVFIAALGLLPQLTTDELAHFLGLEEETVLLEFADQISKGAISAAEANVVAARVEAAEARAEARVEAAEARAEARAEVAEIKAAAAAEIAVAKAEADAAVKVAEAKARCIIEKTALKMKFSNVDLVTISACTGLSIDEIEAI